MGVSSPPDVEHAGDDGSVGASVVVEMAYFIREEIRTAVQREMTATSTALAPPSYDSSAPLLIEDNPASSPDGDMDAEAQDVDKKKPRLWRSCFRAFTIFLPFCAVTSSMSMLSTSGRDELHLATLSVTLLFAMYFVVMLSVIICGFAMSKKLDNPPAIPKPPAPPNPDVQYIVNLTLSYHFLLTYLAFLALMYWWLNIPKDSLRFQFRSATAFDGKLGIPLGTQKLVRCLDRVQEIQKGMHGEGRKASVEDVVSCLVDMGVNATGFIKGVN